MSILTNLQRQFVTSSRNITGCTGYGLSWPPDNLLRTSHKQSSSTAQSHMFFGTNVRMKTPTCSSKLLLKTLCSNAKVKYSCSMPSLPNSRNMSFDSRNNELHDIDYNLGKEPMPQLHNNNREILEDLYLEAVERRHRIETEGGWVIRLANENGYLSWCRNTYLATAVGVACYTQSTVPYAIYATDVFFLMGGVNLLVGTLTYSSQLLMLRQYICMSRVTMVIHTSMAWLHLLMWMAGVAVYLGYADDDDEDTILIIEDARPEDKHNNSGPRKV